jgi:tellurite resistance protein
MSATTDFEEGAGGTTAALGFVDTGPEGAGVAASSLDAEMRVDGGPEVTGRGGFGGASAETDSGEADNGEADNGEADNGEADRGATGCAGFDATGCDGTDDTGCEGTDSPARLDGGISELPLDEGGESEIGCDSCERRRKSTHPTARSAAAAGAMNMKRPGPSAGRATGGGTGAGAGIAGTLDGCVVAMPSGAVQGAKSLGMADGTVGATSSSRPASFATSRSRASRAPRATPDHVPRRTSAAPASFRDMPPFYYAAPMTTGKKVSLEDHADKIREELKSTSRQNDLFKAAVEAGYLTARADGGVDDTERDVLVKAVELLSQGLVIEWETEALIDECKQLADTEGLEKRAAAVGEVLKELDQAEAGLFVAALVARATKGVEKSEAELLKAIGKSAGIGTDKVRDIVKRATSLTNE